MSQIILYDLSSKGSNASWSINPLKSRLALNFKGLAYNTTWVEYSDIAQTLGSLGVPPHPPSSGMTPYTIPTVRLLPNTYVMDSRAIATALESAYPSPSLHLDSPALTTVEELMLNIVLTLRGIWMPAIPIKLLNEGSAETFERTRKERLGISLKELGQKEGGQQAWENAREDIKALGNILTKDESGPFVLGKTPSYADFYIVSALQFFRRIDEGIFKKIIEMEAAFEKLYNASKQWLERDDQ